MNAVENKEELKKRGHRKVLTGVVVSDVEDKTITIEVVRTTAHPLYKKVVNIKKRYAVHDEKNDAKIGDKVTIIETRPMSKRKRWRLLEILSHAE